MTVVKGRPLTDAASYTCDWGGCDAVSTAERLDPNGGQWLGVCAQHEAPADTRTVYRRGNCVKCGKETTLSTAGLVRLHQTPGTFVRCSGSRQLPKGSA